jgi:hypothetical protein
MNIHSEGLYGAFITLVKDKDFGLELESAKPAVDQPVVGMDKRVVEKMFCLHFTMLTLVHICHAFLFY